MRIRSRLHIDEHRQQQLSRVMQLVLVGLVFIGLDRPDFGIVVNASVGLGVTYLPAILERDYRIPMDAGLTLWISSAAFFHALGTVGLPGTETSFYAGIWWWDHFTHALSSSVVAAAGYATVRAVDEHTADIYLPSKFTFVFILLFVLAFGVFWEVIEFAISGISSLAGASSVLTQYGPEDTLLDLVFDAIGGVIVATWGTAHLTDVVGALRQRLDGTAN
ncbi:hypothetical protein C440_10838 [Haloferax mucosum ATCC BAA-1512]|uniref:Membrane-spanning protein n=1 Tax=Haloferax mucosum ATCC BAA-1512 TaxID=662479 RepID=M0IBI1_9EURY|nr:hypothetical protein [Haloferax mucosum]ELZ94111.1 hypothetical protein C440_10838 [Haloferax mucosum ATCC BAA-1512]